MDRRKGVFAASRKWSPTTWFSVKMGILGLLIGSIPLIPSCVPKERPDLSIELAHDSLGLYKDGSFAFPYRLINRGDAAYNIKKGHMVFNLSDENNIRCKHFYEPIEKNDVLKRGETSVIHTDNIGFLDHNKSYKIQIIITYSSSKAIKKDIYYSSANYKIQPDNNNEQLFKIYQKSLDADDGLIKEKKIADLISGCIEVNDNTILKK